MEEGFRLDNNYGNIEVLYDELVNNRIDCELVKSRTGTYLRTRNNNNRYGASVIEEHINYKIDTPKFELALILLDGYNFEIVQHDDITDDVLRFLSKDEVIKTISKINNI